MIARVLLILLIVIVVIVLALSFFSASTVQEVSRRKQFFSNPFTVLFEGTAQEISGSADTASWPFPGTPKITLPPGRTGTDGTFSTLRDDINVTEELLDIERAYDLLAQDAAAARQFGDPSPYRGLVRIADSYSGVMADDPLLEYVTLEVDPNHTGPIAISGWSIQSIYSRARITIPGGTRDFMMGVVPVMSPISLNPGEHMIISSGISPVGASFKENLCTGYLGQFQTFVPSLGERCPTAESEVLANPATTRTADPACVAFARTIPQCHFYFGETPDVTPSCYSFVRNSLTYNGCIANHKWRPSFYGDTWRVFLEQGQELWKQDQDAVRLLDGQGRVVDLWTY